MYYIGICDDEKAVCSELEDVITNFAKKSNLRVEVHVWYTGEKLCDYLQQGNKLDLIFLDIELSGISGIDVGKFLREKLVDLRTAIVYISRKSHYAIDLFRLQPIDFLIKPLETTKIEEVLKIWNERYHDKNKVLEVKTNKSYYSLPYSDIFYLYSENKKITVVMSNETIQFYEKLKNVASLLPSNFLKIHQSYIVNLDYVKESSYEKIVMVDGQCFNISQPYRKQVRETIVSLYREKKHV